tara:strand:+ start:97 stop:288 length:192 start_codon:yes stop_codon:yes gene_type:complete
MNLFLERLLYFWLGITGIGLLIAIIYWALKAIILVAFICFFIAILATAVYHFFIADKKKSEDN